MINDRLWRAPPFLARRIGLAAVFLLQAVSALFFVSDMVFSILGVNVRPISWRLHELLEICAAFGLVAGLVLGGQALLRAQREAASAKERLRRAALTFAELIEERFSDWRLTAAERDVALFVLKGMATAEIAALRATSEGTVKAQTAAIYRKAGVSGRGQLVSLFIEDLMDETHAPRMTEAVQQRAPAA